MRKISKHAITLSAFCMLTASWSFVGCSSDKDIDLSDLDQTIGIGSDNFELPSNSTKNSPLADLLELKDDGVIDTLANGDYVFTKNDTVTPAKPKVKQVSFGRQEATPQNLTVPITTAMIADGAIQADKDYSIPADAPSIITTFKFKENDGEDHHQIDSLWEADINGKVKLTIGVNALSTITSKVSLDIFLPKFFGIDRNLPTNYTIDETIPGDYWKLSINSIETSRDFNLSLLLNQLRNFKSKKPSGAESYMLVNSTDLEMEGKIKMQMRLNTKYFKTSASAGAKTLVISNPDLGKEITVTHAEGWFNPDIDIDPKSTEIKNIPDFLEDDRVKVILSNPSIKIDIDNNIDVEGLLDAKLVATYQDKNQTKTWYRTLAITKNEHIVMKQATGGASLKSTIVICRKKGTDPTVQYIEKRHSDPLYETKINGRSDSVEVYDIAAMLSTIPQKLNIILDANANTKKKGRIDLYKEGTESNPKAHGCGYTINPTYEFMAPLAMEAGSTIVYNDTIDDWNKDIKDNKINFYGSGYLLVTADVRNNTPLEMVFSKPKAIGVKDDKGVASEITDAQVAIVDANENPVSQLTIYQNGDPRNEPLRLKVFGNIENLDGVIFEVMANSTQTTPETLNASKHRIKIDNMKISLRGRVSIDLEK